MAKKSHETIFKLKLNIHELNLIVWSLTNSKIELENSNPGKIQNIKDIKKLMEILEG